MKVIVVGAGIIGSACAHQLARRGAEVLVMDAAVPPAGASATCDGALLIMNKRAGTFDLARAALDAWSRLARLVTGLGYGRNDMLMVAKDSTEQAVLESRYRLLVDNGVAAEVLDPHQARRMEPGLSNAVSGALFSAENRSVEPAEAVMQLLRASQDLGAKVLEEVAAAWVAPGMVQLSNGQVIRADEVVVAAGLNSFSLLRQQHVHAPVWPRRGHMLELYPEAATHISRGVIGAMYADVAHSPDPSLHVVPLVSRTVRGRVLLGSSREAADVSTTVDTDVISAIRSSVARLIPAMEAIPALRTWVGFRPESSDGRPFVGRLEPGLSLAAGHAGEGVTYAALTAEVLTAEILDGRPPIAAWDPHRRQAREHHVGEGS